MINPYQKEKHERELRATIMSKNYQQPVENELTEDVDSLSILDTISFCPEYSWIAAQ